MQIIGFRYAVVRLVALLRARYEYLVILLAYCSQTLIHQ